MKTYKIKEGKHRSGWHFLPVLFGGYYETLTFQINGWYYDDKNVQQSEQLNKIYGYGEFPHHHYNSFRWSFRFCLAENCFDLYSYKYHEGKRTHHYYGTFRCGRPISVPIYRPTFGYVLFPYHGGKAPAPINYSIDIKIS